MTRRGLHASPTCAHARARGHRSFAVTRARPSAGEDGGEGGREGRTGREREAQSDREREANERLLSTNQEVSKRENAVHSTGTGHVATGNEGARCPRPPGRRVTSHSYCGKVSVHVQSRFDRWLSGPCRLSGLLLLRSSCTVHICVLSSCLLCSAGARPWARLHAHCCARLFRCRVAGVVTCRVLRGRWCDCETAV